MVLASLVVKCQLTCRWAWLVAFVQAASSRLRVSRSPILRFRHWRARPDSSISAMSGHESCLEVWWISKRWARRNALAGSNAVFCQV